MKVLTRHDMFDEFAMILEVDDDMYELIKLNPHYYRDEDMLNEAIQHPGDNAMILSLQVNSDIKIIIRRLNFLLKKYKTVSWYDRDNRKFFTRKGSYEMV